MVQPVLTWVAKGIVASVGVAIVGAAIWIFGYTAYDMFKTDFWLSVKVYGAFVVVVAAFVYLMRVEEL